MGAGAFGAGVLSCSEHAIFLLIVFSKIGLGLDGFRLAVVTKEGCVRIVIFIFIGVGGLVLGCCYVGHYSDMHYLPLCRCASH